VSAARPAASNVRPLKIFLGAFGDPGHAFPAIALGRELRARGHEVSIQTWRKWTEDVEREGIRFHAAPEYQVFPTRERPLKPYEAVVRAVHETLPVVRAAAPDVVVSDILTLAPALAAELAGSRWATIVPHTYPPPTPGLPPYGLGAPLPRGPVGRGLWKLLTRATSAGLELGRRELNETRRRVGLAPLPHVHGGISRQLTLVATFPQLEYPRRWPREAHVTGPLLWEPTAAAVEPPPGDEPLVLVAPSTSQDPERRLLDAALRGLAELPVRVLAVQPGAAHPSPPPRARVVPWMSYEATMPLADIVVSHGGHGTLARTLMSGVPTVVVPAAGDMIENGTRVHWAGVGRSLATRFLTPRTLRWAVQRVLEQATFKRRAEELREWSHANPGPERAATLVERFCAGAFD
jgi:UDP:flavonoid glycosyltransferase YjiC (YdhE family)